MICKKITIKGRVHGVGFRYSAEIRAKELGISGYVKNTSEGVEIVAYGDDLSVKQLCDWCKGGPSLSRIDSIDIEKIDELPAGFKVVY